MNLRGILLLVLFIHLASAASLWNRFVNGFQSVFYSSYQEAPFVVVRFEQDFEVRRYHAKKWVCTSHFGNDEDREESRQFLKLFDYITGKNSQGATLSMTIPVTVEYKNEAECSNNYTMCFYIERQHQRNVPSPTESDLFIENRPEKTIFTRKIGGYPDEEDWLEEMANLKALAEENNYYPSGQVYCPYQTIWSEHQEDSKTMSSFRPPLNFEVFGAVTVAEGPYFVFLLSGGLPSSHQ